jgi:hypothetical protein
MTLDDASVPAQVMAPDRNPEGRMTDDERQACFDKISYALSAIRRTGQADRTTLEDAYDTLCMLMSAVDQWDRIKTAVEECLEPDDPLRLPVLLKLKMHDRVDALRRIAGQMRSGFSGSGRERVNTDAWRIRAAPASVSGSPPGCRYQADELQRASHGSRDHDAIGDAADVP